jgi:hypothetical protein
MFLLLSLSLAHAGVVIDVGEPVTLSMGGGWARAFPADEGGWHFLWSAGGDYNVLPMGADLSVRDTDRTRLTGRTDLVDHGITRCPAVLLAAAMFARARRPSKPSWSHPNPLPNAGPTR